MIGVLCALVFWTSTSSAGRVHLHGERRSARAVEDPCDPEDPKFDPENPACTDIDKTADGDSIDDEGPPDDLKDDTTKVEEEDGPPKDGTDGVSSDGSDEVPDEVNEDFNPMCDDPNDPTYDPSDPKCTGDIPMEEGPGDHGDHGPEDMSEMPDDMTEVMGDNSDNMAEEMADVDDGPNFKDLDQNADGAIDINEAQTYATKNGIPAGEIDAIHEYMDEDADGLVSQSEFEGKGAQEAAEDMAPTLPYLDISGDGSLDPDEWSYGCECGKTYLDTCGTPEQCKEIFDLADDDKDGLLTEEEFNGAGDECKTADDGNCDFLAMKKPQKVRLFRAGHNKLSLGQWVQKHFKLSGRALFTLAMLRAQHKKGKIFKFLELIAKQRQHRRNGKAAKEQYPWQRGNHRNAEQVHRLRHRGHRSVRRHMQNHMM